jgi:arabinose-5-phosphate isomerase
LQQTRQAWLDEGRAVLDIEIEALAAQRHALDESFARAAATILQMNGKLVVLGMGKSGIVARKIAATFASTGTPAFFVHAAEARHGDLGMITKNDVVLALSFSGETAELCGLLPAVKRLGADLIAMTGNAESTLARHADIVLHVPVSQEACPMNLAPTASTTATMALGDALAVVILKQRGFREDDFARLHPAGSLGRKLLVIESIMHRGDEMPIVPLHASLREAIMVMSSRRFGIAGISDGDRLAGCITDGDLRRILQSGHVDLDVPVRELIHDKPFTIKANKFASEALRMMEERKITALFVDDDQRRTIGIIHMHDLLREGVA